MTAAIWADFKTEPYLHQLIEFEKHCESEARALLWQMRTGKTKVVIDTACHLYKEGRINAVLIFAPNGVHENWIDRELPIHHWDTVRRKEFFWLTERSGQESYEMEWRDVLLDKDRLAWFSFASETMTRKDVRRMVKHITEKRGCMIVFDESHDFRTPGSKRTQMGRAVAKRGIYRRILTGTPVDNSPLHAFSQYELLKKEALGHDTYEAFKQRYAIYKTQTKRNGQSYPVLDKYRYLEELRDKMAEYSSVVLRSDCHDLPDLIPMQREFELTEEQKRLYRELHTQYEFEIGSGIATLNENTQKLNKLQQVVSGFMIDEYGEVHNIPGGNPRLDALVHEAELCAGKVVIWCAFREDMDRVVARLNQRGHKTVEYHGRISAADKKKARQAFAPGAENDVKALVGYPTAGLDLSSAEKILWYSHTFDAIKRQQADERATAMGGENVPVVDFTASGVDRYILSNVKEKISIGDALSRDGMKEALQRMKI